MSIVLWYEQLVRTMVAMAVFIESYSTDEVTLMKYCSGVARSNYIVIHSHSQHSLLFSINLKLVLF